MQIDESDEQLSKAESGIDESLPPGSNVTIKRDQQSKKHSGSSFSTDDGMQIDESDEHL
jgi:hypothetical protein